MKNNLSDNKSLRKELQKIFSEKKSLVWKSLSIMKLFGIILTVGEFRHQFAGCSRFEFIDPKRLQIAIDIVKQQFAMKTKLFSLSDFSRETSCTIHVGTC